MGISGSSIASIFYSPYLFEIAAAKVEAQRLDVVKSCSLLWQIPTASSVLTSWGPPWIRLLIEGTTFVSSPMLLSGQDTLLVFFQYI